eukprot:868327-Pyramimonas_sp.AAC.1
MAAHPFTRFVAPYGVPPKVPVPPPTCVPHTHFGTPIHTLRGSIGGSTEGPSATARMRPPHP